MKVLILDSSQRVIQDIAFCLEVRYPDATILSAMSVAEGMKLLETEMPDLLMVDGDLPGADILNLVKEIREYSSAPLIILRAGSDFEKIKWLEAGADEYITKPFSPIELLARVKALLRRTGGAGFPVEESVSLGNGLCINFTRREVYLYGQSVRLTPTEFEMLSLLAQNKGRVLTNRTLLEKVWGPEYIQDSGFVKKYIYRLRSKLESDTRIPIIRNERGMGYRLMKVR